ncbi:MAG: helix-turn-helix transcriptional regulator [Bacillota bacterium]|nr:helix-turn-helix transcriptional regulator [Bacillota bacterium]
MITFEIIGERIKKKREFLNLSQKEVSESLSKIGLNLSRETISKIESGSRATNALEIKAIGKVLNITSEELMQENEEKDLVSLFRSRGDELSESAIIELEEIQDFIKGLIAQKKIDNGEIKLKRYESNWG